jgi:hypothetical protein
LHRERGAGGALRVSPKQGMCMGSRASQTARYLNLVGHRSPMHRFAKSVKDAIRSSEGSHSRILALAWVSGPRFAQNPTYLRPTIHPDWYCGARCPVGPLRAIGSGKRWARNAFVVLFVLGIPSLFFIREALSSHGVLSVTIFDVQTMVQLAAIVLLFLPALRPWFSKSARQAEGSVS